MLVNKLIEKSMECHNHNPWHQEEEKTDKKQTNSLFSMSILKSRMNDIYKCCFYLIFIIFKYYCPHLMCIFLAPPLNNDIDAKVYIT